MMINLFSARQKLSKLWFIYSLVLFVIFLLLSLYTSRFDNIRKEAWEWFLPHVYPTLTLITGVFFADFADTRKPSREIPSLFFTIAFGVSIFYLTLVGLVILNPVAKTDNILSHYKDQSVYLIPVQTLTGTFIAIFFSKTGVEPKKTKKKIDPPGS
jgi:uncharacterized membrane protein SirB2